MCGRALRVTVMLLSAKTSHGTIYILVTDSELIFSSLVEALNHDLGNAVIFPVPINLMFDVLDDLFVGI